MINMVKIYTKSCVPCRMLSPILEDLKKEYEGIIDIKEVAVDDGIPEEYKDFNIMSTPTVLFFKDGVFKDKVSGLKIKQVYKEVIEGLK